MKKGIAWASQEEKKYLFTYPQQATEQYHKRQVHLDYQV